MNAPQRITHVVSTGLIVGALAAPTAGAMPAGTDRPSSGEPASVAPIDGGWSSVGAHGPATLDRVATVVWSRTRRCGDLLVASGRPVALPSCPGGWHFIGGHREH
jgi:hypothetical protein